MRTDIKKGLVLATITGLASPMPPPCNSSKDICLNGSSVTIPINGEIANLTTSTLQVTFRARNGTNLRLSNGLQTSDQVAADSPKIENGKATWNLPTRNCTVTAYGQNGRLVVTLSQPDGSNVTWPITGGGVDNKYQSLQYPRGPGRNIPLRDEFWNQGTEGPEKSGTGGDMIIPGNGNNNLDVAVNFMMPFWGYSAGEGRGSAYILPEDIGTKVNHKSVNGSLQTSFTHSFSRKQNTTSYTVIFEITDGSPLASAFSYRRYLQENNKLMRLKDKIAALSDTSRLLGAFHAYCFGVDGCSADSMKKLANAGIKKLWVGYDQESIPQDAVKQAQGQGYIVGPYDTYANGQPSNESDSHVAKWPGNAYPEQCITLYNGKQKLGFGQRGCYMSTQAQALAEPSTGNLAARLNSTTSNGVLSYFLDVDAASEFFTDFSESHGQNMMMDRKNRLDRMLKISKKFVLGSEDSHGWANGVVSYSHGTLTQMDNRFFGALLGVKEVYGGYKPDGGPDMFFKPISLPKNFATTMFDMSYMIPLTEAVLHDSVVNVDRWDVPLHKFPAVEKQRILQNMLYNVPAMLAINGTVIEEKGQQIAKYQNFFQPLHETGALLPLTKFEYLTQDKMLQRTEFGNGDLVLTANFAGEKLGGLEGMCVAAKIRDVEAKLCV
ncbi:hypothetical protein H072_11048 [Dactylellina haptotyla CBS 200.50]|uniref:Alpha-galactosidase n=1 Tax=Dactylellina haptotyla (strain CBS 200.50) TaxID=1284197 RepID=S8A2Y0_DACHA|nr:hypothetical protein H072_11048 [Dactylellina haptotyla CBS 200.50]